MTTLLVDPAELRPARLSPPMSKSDAHRALVLAHILGRPEAATGLGPRETWPGDVVVLERGLRLLESSGPEPADIDCADGGAPFRFLLAQAAVANGRRSRFTGTKRLGERPRAALVDSLSSTLGPFGLRLVEGTPWPLEVFGARDLESAEPAFSVAAGESSQFVSSLLLASAALCRRERRPWKVALRGEPASLGYLELTVRWIEAAGFTVEREASGYVVSPGTAPAQLPEVPGDWSSIGYLLLLAWRCGGSVARVSIAADHPDAHLLRVAEDIGLSLAEPEPGVASLRGVPARGLVASGRDCPDLLPTLAALACVLPGPSELRDVHILRVKESDRVDAIERLVRAAGGTTALLEGDRMRIDPPRAPPTEMRVESRDDHRTAMSAALLSVLTGSKLTLEGADCVAKSFPAFWDELRHTGARATPV